MEEKREGKEKWGDRGEGGKLAYADEGGRHKERGMEQKLHHCKNYFLMALDH